jgi:hypothetical protein
MSVNEYVTFYELKVNLKRFWISCKSRLEIDGSDG